MFWDIFYELCIKSRQKPNAVAKLIGVSSGAVTNWKNRTLPSTDALIKLSKYFNCSIDFLLGNYKNMDFELLNIFHNFDESEKIAFIYALQANLNKKQNQ